MASYTKQCPDCGERINRSARACACGWTENGKGKVQPQAPALCRVDDCSRRLDGDDKLCGYHRALREGRLDAWMASQRDWRIDVFADFSARHRDDSWGALVQVAHEVATNDERRELLNVLKDAVKRGVGAKLPYDPRASAAQIEAGLDAEDEQRIAERKARTRAAVEAYYDKRAHA